MEKYVANVLLQMLLQRHNLIPSAQRLLLFPIPQLFQLPAQSLTSTIRRFGKKKKKRQFFVMYVFSPAEGKHLPEQHSLVRAQHLQWLKYNRVADPLSIFTNTSRLLHL